MANARKLLLWRRWPICCAGCLVLAGVVVFERQPLIDSLRHSERLQAVLSQLASEEHARSPTYADESSAPAPVSDAVLDLASGDARLDSQIRSEMRRWQQDFGFDAKVFDAAVRRCVRAFRPFLLFAGGRDAVFDAFRAAHEDAQNFKKRLDRMGRAFGRAGHGEALRTGAYVFNSIEVAADDWLRDKTLADVKPDFPDSAAPDRRRAMLRASHGTIVNAAGDLVWAGRPDLPETVNTKMAAALIEWIDEFLLAEEDVAALSRVALARLLVLEPGPYGEPPAEATRVVACEAGINWLREARDEARPLFQRTGWVNLARLVRLSTEAAARAHANEPVAERSQNGRIDNSADRFWALSHAESGIAQAGASIESQDRPALLKAPFGSAAAKNARQWWAEGLKMPASLTNSIGMKLMLVPAGEFLMGSAPLDLDQVMRHDPTFSKEWEHEEQPQHRVCISRPFFLGAHEVTRGQFADFVRATDYKTDAGRDGKGGFGFNAASGEFKQDPGYDWQNPGFSQEDSEPVVNVSWNDVAAFCAWLSRKEKMTYRLPTEAEWEYACRAGTTTPYFNGDDPDRLAAVGNVCDATAKQRFPKWMAIGASDGHVFTAPVGSFGANAFGLFDMHGNVWEWCQDWYGPHYYAKSPARDPQGPSAGTVRVFRGGSWYDAAGFCRSAFRYWDVPSYRDYFLGFRVAAFPRGE